MYSSVASFAVFPRIWACFLSSCGFFEDLRVACFWACFIWNLLVFYKFVFCRLLFFQILWHFCSFNLLLRAIWACFCENFLILGLFLLMCLIPATFSLVLIVSWRWALVSFCHLCIKFWGLKFWGSKFLSFMH